MPGIGVLSLLYWLGCVLDPEVGFFTAGIEYILPSEGVKVGKLDAVESNWVRDVTVESCSC